MTKKEKAEWESVGGFVILKKATKMHLRKATLLEILKRIRRAWKGSDFVDGKIEVAIQKIGASSFMVFSPAKDAEALIKDYRRACQDQNVQTCMVYMEFRGAKALYLDLNKPNGIFKMTIEKGS